MYFSSSDGNSIAIDCTSLTGPQGIAGVNGLDGEDGKTPVIVSEVQVLPAAYGSKASA